MAEELKSNFVPKYYHNSNYLQIEKNIISVRGKKALGFSPEATRARIEQNITNARFFKAENNTATQNYTFNKN